jgi:hypothetical protein
MENVQKPSNPTIFYILRVSPSVSWSQWLCDYEPTLFPSTRCFCSHQQNSLQLVCKNFIKEIEGISSWKRSHILEIKMNNSTGSIFPFICFLLSLSFSDLSYPSLILCSSCKATSSEGFISTLKPHSSQTDLLCLMEIKIKYSGKSLSVYIEIYIRTVLYFS